MKRKQPLKSSRADGRGGWVAGKRRNPDVGDWSRIRIDLVALLNDSPPRGPITCRGLAAVLGVSDRSVRRWVSGEDRPDPATQEAIRTWITEQRRANRRNKVTR